MTIFTSHQSHRSNALHLVTTLVILAAALAIPSLAFAIPGAGDFTSTASEQGRQMAHLYNLIAKICVVIFAIVCAFMIAAILKFRRRSDDEMPQQTHGNTSVELGLLVAATIIQIYIGWKTIEVMWFVEKMPEKVEFIVEAHASKWDWKFYYPANAQNSKYIKEAFSSDDLVIPAHVNVKILVTSTDVIHSLFVPELGIKMDAVPGRFNYWWVNADGPINQTVMGTKASRTSSQKGKILPTTRPDHLNEPLKAANFFPESPREYTTVRGLEDRVTYLAEKRIKDTQGESIYSKYDAIEYRGMCTELCGQGHYNMYFRAVAMTSSSFEQWTKDMQSGALKGEVNGAQIYAAKCASCHGANGKGQGTAFPPLANSDYISKDDPENKARHITVVLQGLKGEIKVNGISYNGAMQPWYQTFNDEEVAAVVNHERTSWGNAYGTVTSAQVATTRSALGYPPYPAGGIAPVPKASLLAQGKRIYDACSSCHGTNGKATVAGFPNIAGNPVVIGPTDKLLDVLINGVPNKKMAMGRTMSHIELASVLSYIRTSFGNKGSVVQPGEVARVRKEVTKPSK